MSNKVNPAIQIRTDNTRALVCHRVTGIQRKRETMKYKKTPPPFLCVPVTLWQTNARILFVWISWKTSRTKLSSGQLVGVRTVHADIAVSRTPRHAGEEVRLIFIVALRRGFDRRAQPRLIWA